MCICRKNRAYSVSSGENHETFNLVRRVDGFFGDSGYVRIKFLSVEVLRGTIRKFFSFFPKLSMLAGGLHSREKCMD